MPIQKRQLAKHKALTELLNERMRYVVYHFWSFSFVDYPRYDTEKALLPLIGKTGVYDFGWYNFFELQRVIFNYHCDVAITGV